MIGKVTETSMIAISGEASLTRVSRKVLERKMSPRVLGLAVLQQVVQGATGLILVEMATKISMAGVSSHLKQKQEAKDLLRSLNRKRRDAAAGER